MQAVNVNRFTFQQKPAAPFIYDKSGSRPN
jgi:hypothetical protein